MQLQIMLRAIIDRNSPHHIVLFKTDVCRSSFMSLSVEYAAFENGVTYRLEDVHSFVHIVSSTLVLYQPWRVI
jgi:hypothetical protein